MSLAYGEDLVTLTYNDIRTDLDSGLKKGFFEQFHTDVSFRNASLRTYENDLFCKCRGIDDGSKIVECESCLDWSHYSCYKLKETDVNNWKCTMCRQ